MTTVARLILQDFRSYEALDLAIGGQIVALVGENGAGKTNLLEALSLFAPGRGLRRADLSEMARQAGPGSFAVSIALADDGPRLGIGLGSESDGRRARLARIDGVQVGSALAFSDYLRVVWLTPDLDGLFRGAAGDRRRFLDRLVLAVDPGHATRSNALERALRSRNRILEETPHEVSWLDAIEREIAELGVAVAAARAETVGRLATIIAATADEASPFPRAALGLEGELDRLVAGLPALDAEDRYRDILRQGRQRDRAAGRTLVGPQASDLLVRHAAKDIPAEQGSTGEQKALLIGLVLAHARLVRSMSGLPPLVLLDEVAAHLDPRRRAALYAELAELGSQVWMTGADPALFTDLPAGAQCFTVTSGQVEAIG
ncbi:DNA replication and repair protein RecF [Bosea sp. LC85]|uniref:DNA replication/repair protein RecF n=1 Tax=Bosea sp. LC85 TaxID=1502851 RepID=UPI0004E4053F|nr:DNA replication/repair protein RecF [Bosea sp. LC85]KFC70862.1 DNA replication and repair protein RecF [Bosea sp. LC85]